MSQDLRTKFLKVYANLPLNAREEIIVVIDNEPLTWNAAWLEVETDSPKAKQILDMLSRLHIINI